MYGGRGSRCWHRVEGCGVGVNTTLGQGGCVVLTQGEPRQWVYTGSAPQVMWPLQVPDEDGCSPSHLRHTWAYLHLEALGHAEWLNRRQMVRPSFVLLLARKEERLPGEQAAALWPYLVHLVQNGLVCAVHHNAHSSWSSESQRRLGS